MDVKKNEPCIATAELFGSQIGVDGNLKDLLEKKECKILLKLTNADHTWRVEAILDAEGAKKLMAQIDRCFNDPVAKEHGFKVV